MTIRNHSIVRRLRFPRSESTRDALLQGLLAALLLATSAHVAADEPVSPQEPRVDAVSRVDAEPWVESVGSPQYFALYVSDMERSVAWYRQVLGLDELVGSAAENGAWEIQNLGNDRLLVELIRDDRAQDVDRALGFRKVGFAVADAETVADRIEKATGERPHLVDFEPMGQRILQIRDPDGNTIQLFSPIAAAD